MRDQELASNPALASWAGQRGSLAADVLIVQRKRVTRNTECRTNCE
jgi:hypothetical protein